MSQSEETEPSLGSGYSSVDNNAAELEQSSRRVESWNRGHQAKRARVENIIKVMSGSEETSKVKNEETRMKNSRMVDEDNSSKHQGWKKTKLMNYFQSKPENMHVMADVLKVELSRAVSRSVDSVFKSMQESVEASLVQTEALLCSHMERNQKLIQDSMTEHRRSYSCPQSADYPPSFQAAQHSWNSSKVRLKVNSRSVRAPPMEPMIWGNLFHPHVKVESNSLLKSHLYVLNEGLTTKHLKKAKLVFFFTRYPSSLVLRMCFHDVQFTRCISSQLIKWFSNFREFFYIQMEKSARQAVMEGRSDTRGLAVGRESELFRTLNMHYNKANDFQVPDQFLEVAEITLREFYVAISMGKDGDPSWKKAIYKVICKLDREVPAEFKSLG